MNGDLYQNEKRIREQVCVWVFGERVCFYVREKEREREYVCVCVCVSGCKESVRFWVGKREQEQLVEPEKALYYKKNEGNAFFIY